jgi:hypothetical protein
MKVMAVKVKQRHTIRILYGRKPVAMIVPYLGAKIKERKIGILDVKMNIEFKNNFEMTTEPRNRFTPPPPPGHFLIDDSKNIYIFLILTAVSCFYLRNHYHHWIMVLYPHIGG